MSESFEFDVAYSTSFEQIEQLRAKMLAFVQSERRDYQPSFDVVVKDIPDQEKLVLSADIKYKSNWQQGSIKGIDICLGDHPTAAYLICFSETPEQMDMCA